MGEPKANHVYITCSNCRALLLDLWVRDPAAPQERRVRANCPFCGDSSFARKVKGIFSPGGFGTNKKDDTTDVTESTKIIDCEFKDNGDVAVTLERAGEPVYHV